MMLLKINPKLDFNFFFNISQSGCHLCSHKIVLEKHRKVSGQTDHHWRTDSELESLLVNLSSYLKCTWLYFGVRRGDDLHLADFSHAFFLLKGFEFKKFN